MVTVSEPMASNSGARPTITSGSPPHMQTRLPEAAADGPPLTPQSTMGTLSAAASAPMAATHAVVIVLTTTTVVPGTPAANTPSGPDSTARTCSSFTTATTTMSDS